MKRLFLCVTLLLAVALLAAACGTKPQPSAKPAPATATAAPQPAAKPVKLTFSTALIGPPSLYATTIQWYLDEVEKRTNGKVTFTRYWAGALTKSGEELEACKKGVADLAFFIFAYYPGPLAGNNWRSALWWVPPFDVLTEIQRKLYAEPALAAEWTPWNQRIIATTYIAGGYQIVTKKPINTLADVKGLKMAASGKYFPLSLKALGITTAPTPEAERYVSVQTGLLDSVLQGVGSTAGAGLFDFFKYSYDIGHRGSGNPITINNDVWNKLPDDVKKVMTDTGLELEKYSIDVGLKEANELAAKYSSQGVTFGKWSDAMLGEWANTMPNIVQTWVDDVEAKQIPGTAIMKSVFAKFDQVGFKQPGGKVWLK